MSYQIQLPNGTPFATINDGTINQASSVALPGKNYAGYGQFLDQNFINILANMANSTAPTAPLVGQLWFNSTTGVINVYNGTNWVPLASQTSSSTAPTNPTVGTLWYDSSNQQLNVWNGSAWVLVGPAYTPTFGKTGAIASQISDGTTAHTVTELYVNNTIVGIVSNSATFTPNPAVPGFTQVYPGITLSNGTNLPGNVVPQFSGVATSAQYADVAERFAADDVYEPGTVVELGGSAEITKSTTELSNNVFGVISTRAAYLMNNGAGSDETHPPVAMTGRVPVKVIGIVNKGDRLVSAGDGIARVAVESELTPFNVIGRALTNKTDTGVGTVEAIVTIKS